MSETGGTGEGRGWAERLLARAIGNGEAAEGILGDLREEARRKGVEPGSMRYRAMVLGLVPRFLLERGRSVDPGRAARSAGGAAADAGRSLHRARESATAALLHDARVALRSLARNPGFMAVAALTVALGIGATTATFSVVSGVLLRPLPYPEGDELLRVHASWEGNPVGDLSPGEHFDLLDRLQTFEAFGTYAYGDFTMTDDDGARRLPAAFVSAGVLNALDVEPALGRTFGPDEDGPASTVVLVSHGFWQRELGGDPAAVGQEIPGQGVTLLGVLPPDFRLPEGVVGGDPVQMIAPLGLDRTQIQSHGSHFLLGVGRMRAGATVEEARADVARVGTWIYDNHAADYGGPMRFDALPLSEALLGDSRPALLLLLAAAGFVLLIACANTANLLLTRADARRRDQALRAALGASRARILRQQLLESLALGALGGAAGLAFAYAGIDALAALNPPDIPRMDAVAVDGPVLLFALVASLGTGMLFGLLPALQAARRDAAGSLREGGRSVQGERRGARSRRLLVVGQTAFAVVLLSGAILFTRSFEALVGVDPGVDVANVLTARVDAPVERYPDDAEVRAAFGELERRLASRPGVVAAGAVVNLPLDRDLGDMGVELEGQPIPPGGDKPAADWQVVTPGWFEVMRPTLLDGRFLDARDGPDAPGSAVINETMADRFWPNESALGSRFLLGGGSDPGWVTVVGIVRDVRHDGLSVPVKPQFFVAHRQFTFWNGGGPARDMALVLRTDGAPAGFADDVRAVVREVDPRMAVSDVRTMEEIRSAALSRPRFLVSLLGAFGVVALVIAAVGIYGVVSYGVRRRTGEIGVRIALGAGRGRVTRMILGEGSKLVGVGLLLGVVGAVLLARTVSSLLFGVSPGDPVTLLLVTTTLGAVALFATWIPTLRATRIDPTRALRSE